MMSIKCYSDLIKIKSFEDRVRYLMVGGRVGVETFGHQRYLNQMLYGLPEWRRTRHKIIIRDNGCDLAHPDYMIRGPIYIHHIRPITIDDVINRSDKIFDLENLISTSFNTHNLIHYGNERQIPKDYVARKPNDTCPWKEVCKNEQK